MTTSNWWMGIGGALILHLLTACGGHARVGSNGGTGLGETEQAVTSCNVPIQSLCSAWSGAGFSSEELEAGCPEGATASTDACPTDGGFGQCALLTSGSDDEMRTTYYEGWPDALKPSLIESCERGGGRWIEL
jgi:hypothetical protein